MRKIILFSFLFLFLHFFSQLNCEKRFDFSFGFMMNIGENQEKVFDNGRLLSLLQWPILPSFNLNIELGLSIPYFHFVFENSFGIPAFSGMMKDSDYTCPTSSQKTLFSSHKTTLKESILTNSLVGIPFIVFSSHQKKYSIILEPQVGFCFSLKKWYAKDGYTQYKSEDGSKFWKAEWPKKEYNGDGVEYNQKIFFPFIAFDTKILIQNKINMTFSVLFSPLLQGKTKDIHFDTKKIYIDSFSIPSYAFEFKSIFEKELSKTISIYTKLKFFYFYSKVGKTTVVQEDTNEELATYPKGSSGFEGKELKLTIAISFNVSWL